MNRLLGTSLLLMFLTIAGCGQSEKTETKQGSTESTAEKTAVIAQQAEPAVKTTVAETKEMATEAAEKTQESAGKVVAASEETIQEAKETASGTMKAVADKTETAANAAAKAADEAVASAPQTASPDKLVLEASYGNVTFPHALHKDTYACSICHGEGTPGLFALDKDKAHALCKDCHKREGVGPTGCKDCHKK